MKRFLVAAAFAAFLPASVSAAVIDLDTLVGWHIQDVFGDVPFFFTDSYTTAVGARVRVTDLYVWGDEYNYYINGNFAGTILAPMPPADFEGDPELAWASKAFANAWIMLDAGDVLSFESITIPVGFGDATIAVSTYVPEPASWAMMITGFGLMGVALRRRTLATA